MGKILTKEEFINRCLSVHGDKYDYSQTEYINSRENINIICKIHGVFPQEAHGHLRGKGCKKCGRLVSNSKTTFTLKEFVALSNIKHNSFYNYDKVVYSNNLSKVIITCPIHGDFVQGAREHLRGNGCPGCSRMNNNGYTRTKWVSHCAKNGKEFASVYIVEMYNSEERFIKIGLTAKSVPERFAKSQSIKYNWKLIREIKCSPADAFDLENSLHLAYKDFKYIPQNKFAGCTECFNISILNKVK